MLELLVIMGLAALGAGLGLIGEDDAGSADAAAEASVATDDGTDTDPDLAQLQDDDMASAQAHSEERPSEAPQATQNAPWAGFEAALPVTDAAPASIGGFDASDDMLVVLLEQDIEGDGVLRIEADADGAQQVYLDALHLAEVTLAPGATPLSEHSVALLIDPTKHG